MANYVFIACSLDGFIAKADGGLDWLLNIPNESGSDYGFSDFISGIDGIVMGRNTFETVLKFPQWMYPRPVYVLSSRLERIPDNLKGKAEIIRGTPLEVINELGRKGMDNLYIDGGITIQSFLKEDLIDHLIVTFISKLIGDGIPLFDRIGKELHFQLVGQEVLNPYAIKCHFVRTRS